MEANLIAEYSHRNQIIFVRRDTEAKFFYESYLFYMYEYFAKFLFKLWKRVIKYGAFCTGIM